MDDNGTGDSLTSGGDSSQPGQRRRRTVQPMVIRRRRRRIVVGASVTGIIVISFGLWLGYTAREAHSHLNEARDHATAAKDALLDGRSEDALRSATDADKYAALAESDTGSVPWRIAAAVPWLGAPFESAQEISAVVRGLTRDVLTPVVDAGSSLVPDHLIQAGGRVNLQPLHDAAPVLARTSVAAQQLADKAAAVSDAGYLSVVDDARTQLQDQTADLSKLLTNTATAAELAPAMLGADGPRNYFIGFQTNAEARGTGGLLGGFGVIRTNSGAIAVDTLGANIELAPADMQPIDLGPDYAALYGRSRPTTDFRNSNLSSHFPYAAQIWQSLWRQESGETVDGAIATDPIALSYILGAVGSVKMPDGEVITKDNVVELTESTAYVRFADDNAARKAYLQAVAAKVVEKLTGNLSNPQAVLDALGRAAGEGRIAVWSANPAEQEVLTGTILGHTIPGDAAPYAGVVINNQSGNKLDYYLTREIDYTSGSCEGETRESTVTVRLTNNTPAGDLPDYMAGMFLNPQNLPKGTNVSGVKLVATQGSTLRKITVDGGPLFNTTGKELGHDTFEVFAPVPQGKTVEVKFEYIEPTVPGEARVPVQPLVDTPTVSVDVPVCGKPE
ncbi:DUF4012 domain-containing protein [Rhodococcus sp. NPDC003318]|uniref:DUF4012 domain-containing protein n=1 Tax=Rhodococcus sp. NPDC003318 TaxID=3364503 RepID=UPI0036AAB358